MKTYMVIEAYPFGQGFRMVKAFASKERAEEFAKEEEAKIPPDYKPEYDEWGLVEGKEYVVIAIVYDDSL